ncbi:MAG TPA: primosomal protein N' [Candidatus Acidoferrales bacterium]|nr:primosomal protein N' [Candidatus Acidoferrales bacterium]
MIARVSLEIALRKEFDYSIPPGLIGRIEVGSRVQVPFGPRKIYGCVTALAGESAHANLKPIFKVIGAQTLVTPRVLNLARWIAHYYCCAPETALKSVLPEAVRKREEGWKKQLFVRALAVNGELPRLPKRQQEIWNIIEERREVLLAELLELAETTAATVRRLEDRGLVEITSDIAERDPYAREHILPTQPLSLNPAQSAALEKIKNRMSEAGSQKSETVNLTSDPRPPTSVFLLHGVTGSGKTEVYLQALAHALEQGKGAIVLVPEISLTPQTVERFKARFSTGRWQTLVAVLHSHLSAGERHDEWHKIRQGRARIVIGARSAIFAPVEPLGLIIVDEEHEHTYKQEEAPRYHARDVAIMRGQMENAVVVLGSATPSLESYYNCKKGKYTLLELPERVDNQKMPRVRVVDMRQAATREKGPPIFAPQLKEAIHQRLERGEQTILFLNRRGYSTALQCPKCGFVASCPNCSLALTYHRPEQRLRCHICAHSETAPSVCPNQKCKNPAIRFAGTGTQRVEETLAKLFPQARVRRMDADTMKRKDDYRKTLGDFRAGKTDILVGTQMIAKGLHFPNVTLVGIIYADLALHQPDFRAGERTFQLLTQVAGRAGRGDVEGEVFVQAFSPFHPAIQYARRHDFTGFYEQEIEFREQLKYPPVSRVALLTLKGRNEDKVKFSAEHLKRELEKNLQPASQGAASVPASRFENSNAGSPVVSLQWETKGTFKDLIIAGPAPAPLLRAEQFYRYQIMLRTRAMSKLSQMLAKIVEILALPEDVTLAVDIDPVNLG